MIKATRRIAISGYRLTALTWACILCITASTVARNNILHDQRQIIEQETNKTELLVPAISTKEKSTRSITSDINTMFTKLCSLETILSTPVTPLVPCTIEIAQSDIPFTASTDGASYIVTEAISHTSASPAIAISGDGITLDMLGHQINMTSGSGAPISITGSQATVKNGFIRVVGAATTPPAGIAIATTGTQAIIDRITVDITLVGTIIGILNEAEQVWMSRLQVVMPSAGGQAIYLKGALSSTMIDQFVIVTNIFGSAPAIQTETSTGSTLGTVIKNGTITYRRNDIIGNPDQAAIFITETSGTDSPAVTVENVAIATLLDVNNSSDSRGIHVKGNGSTTESVTLQNITLRNGETANTGIGIHISDTQATIKECHVREYNEGILWENTTGGSAIENDTFSCPTGFKVTDSQGLILKKNVAFEADTAGFDISGPVTTATDIILEENSSIHTGFTEVAGTGFSIAATCSRITLKSNVALGHVTGFLDSGATTILFANNIAQNNTTDYSGVGNTFSLAALAGEGYWHNATV